MRDDPIPGTEQTQQLRVFSPRIIEDGIERVGRKPQAAPFGDGQVERRLILQQLRFTVEQTGSGNRAGRAGRPGRLNQFQ